MRIIVFTYITAYIDIAIHSAPAHKLNHLLLEGCSASALLIELVPDHVPMFVKYSPCEDAVRVVCIRGGFNRPDFETKDSMWPYYIGRLTSSYD